jgi:1,2-beta-oligoglucan phosphorylase
VGLSYQTLRACADLFRTINRNDRAAELDRRCDAIREDFNRLLIRDGVVAGFGHLDKSGSVTHLLHPSDETTGIHYRLLPMIRGILSGLLTPEQAEQHLDLIASHLLGPDGARLMDRPPAYTGGLQRHFRRAESSSFFGREIGIMYMHAHLRYAESLARAGRADEFFRALRQAVPVGIRDLVPSAELRQSNCYYSSSDAAFADRYEASRRYDDIHTGAVALKGGWRIYSSGPGIFLGLITSQFLGMRHRGGQTILDPVIPAELDGMTARMDFRGRTVEFTYHVTGPGAGPREIRINGKPVEFTREANPYRPGGALIPDAVLEQACDRDVNSVEISL